VAIPDAIFGDDFDLSYRHNIALIYEIA
jgi:hypothetical protein